MQIKRAEKKDGVLDPEVRSERLRLTSLEAPWHILRNYDFDMILEGI